jgi:DNA adenine methylase
MKPFLKWVGGKSQILDEVLSKFPKKFDNYHEIFLGGGSVLFGTLLKIRSKEINVTGEVYAYDINASLINTYKCIQETPDEIYANILTLIENYNKCPVDNGNNKPSNLVEAMTSKESYYYWVRKEFNSLKSESAEEILLKSAMFIFLNKTCFRGLYRESKNGFNVPFGNYKTPEIANLEHLREISKLIEGVNFQCLDFENSLLNVAKGDFVYLDPPYAPENDKSFTKYSIEDFTIDKHNKLFNMVKELQCSFVMSNANVPLVIDSFRAQMSPDTGGVKAQMSLDIKDVKGQSQGFIIDRISCKRAINSKNPGAKTTEVLISKI